MLVNLTISHTSHPRSECAPQVWEMVVRARNQMMMMKGVTQVSVGVMLEVVVQGQDWETVDVQLVVNVMVQVVEKL
jgi:hypothetical protein